MSFTNAWDETDPQDGDDARNGDDVIRQFKQDIRERIAVDHVMTGTDAATTGMHKSIRLIETADGGTGAAGIPILSAQTASGKPELVYTDEDDTDVQITSAGKINAAAVGGVYAVTNLAAVANILEYVYPVGSVVTLGVSTNPATLFGIGTWTAIAGKVVVGLDSGDTSFDTLDETGGAKTVSIAHTHSVPYSGWSASTAGGGTGKLDTGTNDASQITTANNTTGAASVTSVSTLQPYIVKYVWQRTA